MANREHFATIDQYIETFPKDVQKLLTSMRRTIRRAVPEAVETISYDMPAFKLNGRLLVSFGAWKHHIGLYPIPSGTEAFKREISRYCDRRRAKSSVRFPLDHPIPRDLVAQLAIFRSKEAVRKG